MASDKQPVTFTGFNNPPAVGRVIVDKKDGIGGIIKNVLLHVNRVEEDRIFPS
jgi:hypothetical protein